MLLLPPLCTAHKVQCTSPIAKATRGIPGLFHDPMGRWNGARCLQQPRHPAREWACFCPQCGLEANVGPPLVGHHVCCTVSDSLAPAGSLPARLCTVSHWLRQHTRETVRCTWSAFQKTVFKTGNEDNPFCIQILSCRI